jgi:hypothetical protein
MVGCAAESSFNLPFTQEMLSDALGLSAPHLNRMLTQLRAEGMIAVNEQRVEFTDLRAVQLLAQFQPVHPAQRPQFPTPIQDIALNLAFAVLGERRLNRTYSEYMTIAAKLPPLKVLTFKINEFLRQLNKCDGCNGVRLPELCRFRAGDQRVVFEPYPNHISYETVRTALEISGMREARWRKAKFL